MAQIDLLKTEKIEKQKMKKHERVYSTYSVYNIDNEKYLQIDMYGKPERENPEKVSQTIQIDRETAIHLVNLLTREFDLV